jgi:hypothetical protein
VIDLPDDRVPAALSATKWIRVGPHTKVSDVANDIAGAMHADARPNPAVAAPPSWTIQPLSGQLGLDPRDEAIYAFACRLQLEDPSPFVGVDRIRAFANEQGINESDLRVALSEFESKGYIEDRRSARGGLLPVAIRLTPVGFYSYMWSYENQRYRHARQEVVSAILNDRASELDELAGVVSEPSCSLLELIIKKLEADRHLTVVWGLGVTKWVAKDSLARQLE